VAARSGVDCSYLYGYNALVYQIQQTAVFAKWLSGLRDIRAKARILARLDSARLGNLGDVVSIGGGVSEIRVDVEAGYRVYFTRRHRVIVILLCGGDISTQARDIARARLIARAIE
jgi:putative addiction module killer protein